MRWRFAIRAAAIVALLAVVGCSHSPTQPHRDETPPAAIADLVVTDSSATTITLSWSAPGDDGDVGTAAAYDLRYSTTTLDAATFGSADQATGEPDPAVAGSSQYLTVTGLLPGTTYHFRMLATDERPSSSELSNVATGTTGPQVINGDTESPAAVTNLAPTAVTPSSATLVWTAPGDDGTAGTASTYDLRYSTATITPLNFGMATPVAGVPAPSPPGSSELMTVTGLAAGTEYFFALKSSDEVPNVSALSNVVQLITETAPDTTLFATPVSVATGNGPRSLAIGDLNGDSKPDLVTTNYFGHTVSVLLNTGGTFAGKTDFAAGQYPFGLAVGDLKGDGKADIVASNYFGSTVSVLFGNGSGGFAAVDQLNVGTTPLSVVIGDLVVDGVPDIITADYSDYTISVLPGYATGAFLQPPLHFEAGGGPVAVAFGDVSGDGRPDVVTADFDAGTVSVILTDANNEILPPHDLAVGSSPIGVAIGDVNGDTKPDLITANEAGSTISVLLGSGGGSFGTSNDYATGANPHSVAMGDFDGDGHLDLVTANFTAGSVSVLLGNGDGTFKPKVDIPTGNNASSVAIADLNSDGKLDVAVANYGSATISILINRTGTLAWRWSGPSAARLRRPPFRTR